MPATVYFANLHCRTEQSNKLSKIQRLCDAVGLKKTLRKNEVAGIKLHFGEKGGMEEKIAQKNNIPFFPIKAIKLDRTKLAKNLKIPFVLPKYIAEAVELLQNLNADVVFSKGGYVSLPITYACKRLKIPYVIHEADKSLGVANKLAEMIKAGKEAIAIFNEPLLGEFFNLYQKVL